MTATALLIAALGIVAHTAFAGKSAPARIAAVIAKHGRARMVVGWALGLYLTYGATSLIALALLDRGGALVDMPVELLLTAWSIGLPGDMDDTTLAVLGAEIATGLALGIAILWWRRRRGLSPLGMKLRSPAAAKTPAERWAALLLSLSAGISEELFFRLLLPLLGAIVTGSGMAGLLMGLGAFALAHRYQGMVGMLAVTLVGAVLTTLYVASGRLWVAMALHVAIDVVALIVRQALTPGTD